MVFGGLNGSIIENLTDTYPKIRSSCRETFVRLDGAFWLDPMVLRFLHPGPAGFAFASTLSSVLYTMCEGFQGTLSLHCRPRMMSSGHVVCFFRLLIQRVYRRLIDLINAKMSLVGGTLGSQLRCFGVIIW